MELKLIELNRLSVQTIHNDSVVVNENSNDLQINALNKELESVVVNENSDDPQINALNKELESLRNELKSKDEMINKLMKKSLTY